jgi:hypothetical protein
MGTKMLNDKQIAAADQLTSAVDAVVNSGLYTSAKVVVARTTIAGQEHDTMCVVFAESEEIAQYIGTRIRTSCRTDNTQQPLPLGAGFQWMPKT